VPIGSCCGEVTATYGVAHVGTTVLHAHRSTCGEARRCTGRAGDWTVTLVAS
jgi:hypothetical protein